MSRPMIDSSRPRKYSLKEVYLHQTRFSLWIVIHNDVLDITKFISKHPGGSGPIMRYAGLDASLAFDEIGHSHEARTLAQQFKIGWLPPAERTRYHEMDTCASSERTKARRGRPRRGSGKWKWALLLLAMLLIAGYGYKKYGKQ